MNTLKFGFNRYLTLLQTNPVITRCLTTGLVITASDIISQKFIENQKQFSVNWTLKKFFLGAGILSVASYGYLYRLAPKILSLLPQTSMFIKYKSYSYLAMDLCFYSPFSVCLNVMGINMLNQLNFKKALENSK